MSHTPELSLKTPPGFDFWRTAFSHGWCALVPFSHDPERQQLERTLQLSDGTIVHCILIGSPGTITIRLSSSSVLPHTRKQEAVQQLRTCLRLDEDFSDFHAEANRIPEFRWVVRSGAGRLLRAPTVFEDAVKTICTTNCTWGLTTLMVTNLVRRAGRRLNDSQCAFPTPEAVASLSEKVLRREVKAGYRSPFLLELARRVSSGEIDIESWRSSPLPSDELFTAIRSVKGMGPYAAGNMLKLLGRYDELALDSWVRAKYYELHRKGRKVKDATIEKDYARFGKWRGLFFWLEMTREWHADKFHLPV